MAILLMIPNSARPKLKESQQKKAYLLSLAFAGTLDSPFLFPSWVFSCSLRSRSCSSNLVSKQVIPYFILRIFCSMQKLLQNFFCFCPALLVQQSGEPVRCNDIFGMFAECPGTPAIQSLFQILKIMVALIRHHIGVQFLCQPVFIFAICEKA